MASMTDRIDEDLKVAAKARQEVRLGTVRMLKSAVKYKEIEAGASLDDAEVIQVIGALVKQRRDSIEAYTKGGRQDLAAREQEEIAVLQAYLPEPLSAEELAALVAGAVAEAGASSLKDMGKVMKLLQPRVAGKVEGKALSEAVKAQLVPGKA